MANKDVLFFYDVEEITNLVQSIIDKGKVADKVFICFDRSSKTFYVDKDVADRESRPAFKLQRLIQINNRAHWEPNDVSILSIDDMVEKESTK